MYLIMMDRKHLSGNTCCSRNRRWQDRLFALAGYSKTSMCILIVNSCGASREREEICEGRREDTERSRA